MNRQEFAAAHRDARKVLSFNDAMVTGGFSADGASSPVSSLYLGIDDAVWYAANSTLSKWGRGDILVHPYFRDRDGKWTRLSLSARGKRVRLPGVRA
jgi:hypothetical protein